MSTYVPISQLNELMYVTEDDMISIVDSGSKTTFEATVKTVKDYFATSGSVLTSSWASQSISTSYAVKTDTASYMYPRLYDMTASWANNLVDGAVAGTASLAYNARTASRIEGIGSSYVERMVVSTDTSITSSGHVSLRSKNQLTSSATTDSIKSQTLFFSKDYKAITQPSGITGYGKLFHFDDGVNQKMVFDVGHDYVVTPNGPDIASIAGNSQGILFQSDEAGNPNGLNRTSSLFFLSASGVTYGRTFEGYVYSSSIANSGQVSFYGTASFASGSEYAINSPFPLPMAAIVAYAGIPTGVEWTDWAWSMGETYNSIAYPSFAAQVGTSFGTQATVTEAIYANTRKIIITITAGSSGIVSILWNGVTYHYLNLQSTPTYTITITGLANSHAYSYVYTDYGWYPQVQVTRNFTLGIASAPVVNNTYNVGPTDYRVPNMQSYFLTQVVNDPLNWAIRLAT